MLESAERMKCLKTSLPPIHLCPVDCYVYCFSVGLRQIKELNEERHLIWQLREERGGGG